MAAPRRTCNRGDFLKNFILKKDGGASLKMLRNRNGKIYACAGEAGETPCKPEYRILPLRREKSPVTLIQTTIVQRRRESCDLGCLICRENLLRRERGKLLRQRDELKLCVPTFQKTKTKLVLIQAVKEEHLPKGAEYSADSRQEQDGTLRPYLTKINRMFYQRVKCDSNNVSSIYIYIYIILT